MTEQLLGIAGTIISILIGIIQVAFFLWVRVMNASITELRKHMNTSLAELRTSHSEYKLHVAENYVTNVILSDHLDRFEKSLDEIKIMIRGQH